MAIVALCAKPITELMPGFAAGEFHRAASGLAWLLGCHGVGASLAGVWMSFRIGIKSLLTMACIAIIAMSAGLILFVGFNSFVIGCMLMAFVGFFFVVMDISSQTLVQSSIRSRFRGRTMSIYGMIAQGGPAVGALIMGTYRGDGGVAMAGVCRRLHCADRRVPRLGIPQADRRPPSNSGREGLVPVSASSRGQFVGNLRGAHLIDHRFGYGIETELDIRSAQLLAAQDDRDRAYRTALLGMDVMRRHDVDLALRTGGDGRHLHFGIAWLASIIDAVIALQALCPIEDAIKHPGLAMIMRPPRRPGTRTTALMAKPWSSST